ncbi:hypothetical protein BT69DRAFT_1283981 [Atractiella rhizophila]|nr:hypothetical protein BT69DRAFT_1283981 [Atractiella rhizophila]
MAPGGVPWFILVGHLAEDDPSSNLPMPPGMEPRPSRLFFLITDPSHATDYSIHGIFYRFRRNELDVQRFHRYRMRRERTEAEKEEEEVLGADGRESGGGRDWWHARNDSGASSSTGHGAIGPASPASASSSSSRFGGDDVSFTCSAVAVGKVTSGYAWMIEDLLRVEVLQADEHRVFLASYSQRTWMKTALRKLRDKGLAVGDPCEWVEEQWLEEEGMRLLEDRLGLT